MAVAVMGALRALGMGTYNDAITSLFTRTIVLDKQQFVQPVTVIYDNYFTIM